eukprot:CAMPEP_0204571464 /NCGR_PEP_ID=MMETSP0661-20131031/38906_1 /ASSEMBLY_ACC=CAM_ASM_000606 /TAXON_ID=109239 /ORGANISM="Alexandrium margalefi, Strain AMGDE01CS-322" /LENGTH=104 /DNA_ID=CAMNT_0051579725 /DNA_START=19 /DNA_END=330 /DNA_ORIENTATION=-
MRALAAARTNELGTVGEAPRSAAGGPTPSLRGADLDRVQLRPTSGAFYQRPDFLNPRAAADAAFPDDDAGTMTNCHRCLCVSRRHWRGGLGVEPRRREKEEAPV